MVPHREWAADGIYDVRVHEMANAAVEAHID
jgi:hypothetical protein